MSTEVELRGLMEKLTGQPSPVSLVPRRALELLETDGLGYSQFNELLLLLGYDRICPELFQYFVDRTTIYISGSAIRSLNGLTEAVRDFRCLGLLLFGNVKFAFKRFGASADELEHWLEVLRPRDESTYRDRHEAIQPVVPIAPTDTYLLGYLIEAEIKRKLADEPGNEGLRELDRRRQEIIEQGKRNHSAYLVSDHLDVYVATSMRERHEYVAVNELCQSIFSHPTLNSLKLRWFDPTQAYCADRIDKGLAEALMLKRAKCTVYLAQESDTLGKDSELASTLAQGKPVIAFVPDPDDKFADRLLDKMRPSDPSVSDEHWLLRLLQLYKPDAAWSSEIVRKWLRDPSVLKTDRGTLESEVRSAIKSHYSRRATMLRDQHPLGIQVNLTTGVANGVLVARSEAICAEVIRRILTATLEFDVEDKTINGLDYVFLRERVSGCIFRVMTGDQQLTNSFWNFYLD